VQASEVTRQDRELISEMIGKEALKTINDKVLSDACWMYVAIFKNIDDNG
jgi:hypothetical protein